MSNNEVLIKIYDGDFIGWTYATLIEKYTELDSLEKWKIETVDGTVLVRWVKENYAEFIQDGCGYVLGDGYATEAMINFDIWDKENFYESWDDTEYFRKLFESNKDKIYKFKWNGKEFWELIGEEDEREGALFYTKELIFLKNKAHPLKG